MLLALDIGNTNITIGIIENSEVSFFPTPCAFLNSPSLASGLLVADPCWCDMYVFKNDSERYKISIKSLEISKKNTIR